MIEPILRDKELQTRLEQDGYVVFDFITPQQAGLIAKIFYELHPEMPQGFYSTASISDDSIKNMISRNVDQVIGARLEEVFCNFKKLGISFLCKAPGENGKVGVHSDWMVVDESEYFSGTVWIPTTDTTEENGALNVLPGSHKFFTQLRSSSIPVPYQGYEKEIWDQMITVPMKTGQAFLLNHAVLHASSANITSKERLILVCGIASVGARLMYYHGTDRGTVEKFDMPDDMFMRHSEIGGRPTIGLKVDEFEYRVKRMDRDKIQQLITCSKMEHFGHEKPSVNSEELKAVSKLTAMDSEDGFSRYSPLGILRKIQKRLLG